jgi:hypothetical protein
MTHAHATAPATTTAKLKARATGPGSGTTHRCARRSSILSSNVSQSIT